MDCASSQRSHTLNPQSTILSLQNKTIDEATLSNIPLAHKEDSETFDGLGLRDESSNLRSMKTYDYDANSLAIGAANDGLEDASRILAET